MKENFFKTGVKWINRRSRRFTVRQWIAGLVVFCALGVGLSAYLISSAFLPGMNYQFKIQPISLPGFFDSTGEEQVPPLQKIRTWADSVRRYYTPLPDSISMLENKQNREQSNLKNHGNIR